MKFKVLLLSSLLTLGTVSAVADEPKVDDSKPDGTMRKLIDVSKLHSLGWMHHVEIENGVRKLFEWYRQSLI